ncbi:hypothetical protein ANO11243_051940 [Dothideomycetidae sp. 11243]|nr:hypothetical protein ANO11243_051940 [fungal sp. No.11243]
MQSIHRKVAKITNKRSADQADVSTILEEFRVADDLLDHFMDAVRSFQNAWKGVLAFQLGIARELETLYSPIHDPESQFNAATDPAMLDKAVQFRTSYSDLEKELQQETDWIQTKLLHPAMDAKQSIAPLKKVVKKRENHKLDYERYQARVDHAKTKGAKSQRDEATLIKHEADLSGALVLYQNADEQIRRSMPAVIDAIQVLVPLLLNEQIMLQHALVGQLYTVLHEYCQQFGFPSPAPPMEQVIAAWNNQFGALRREVETELNVLATGKTVHQPMSGPEKTKTVTGLGIRSRLPGSRTPSQQTVPQIRRQSSNALEIEDVDTPPPKPPRPDEEAPPPKPPRPSPGPIPLASKPRTASTLSVPGSGMATPGALELANARRRSSASTTASTNEGPGARQGGSPYQNDYFTQQRSASTTSIASSIASKKKPPPPVPVKRKITGQDMFVIALYDFGGQGDSDLAFREGDRIKVVKKTESTDDWWTGELGGRTGSFPANYVQLP